MMTGCSYYLNGSSFAPIEEKAKARLMSKEGIEFDNVTKSTPETTEKALPKFKERDVETVKKIDLPKESVELTLANIRALALENNLDLKIAEIDPKIAATQVSEEEAKFDDLIFAKAKYGSKNMPSQNLDVVKFTPTTENGLLKNEVDKLTAIPQLTQVLEMEAGIVIPLRTGAQSEGIGQSVIGRLRHFALARGYQRHCRRHGPSSPKTSR